MISYLGDFAEDDTVYIMFNTFSSDDPSASCTITNFVNTDVHIHKDDGLTQRNNAAGITVSVDFDGITGSHMVKIDTSDDTVGGFWVTGSDYFVRIEGTTIDGATINSVIGQFSIENRFNGVDVVKISGDSTAADNAELAFDGTGYGFTNCTIPTVTTSTEHTAQTGDSFARIGATGSGLTSLAQAATALTDVTWTDAKAAFIDHSIATVDTNLDTLLIRITAARAGYLDNLSAGAVALAATALTDATWTDAKAAFLDHSIATVDTNVDTLLTRITAARAGYLDNLSAGAVALAYALATAQTDLDTITGTDGVTLATAQALYAPNKVVPDVAGTAATLHGVTDSKVDAVQTDATAIKAKTDNLPSGIAKNVALSNFQAYMVLSSDHVTAATGKTLTGTISKDGGAFASLTNAITEIANGLYKVNITQTEMNADVITLKFTETDCDQRVVVIHTT